MQAYVNSRNRESAIWTLSRDVQVLLLVQLCSRCQFFRLFGHREPTPMYTMFAIYPRKENFSEQGAVY